MPRRGRGTHVSVAVSDPNFVRATVYGRRIAPSAGSNRKFPFNADSSRLIVPFIAPAACRAAAYARMSAVLMVIGRLRKDAKEFVPTTCTGVALRPDLQVH